ncbi:MAG: Iron-regulated protein precursor [Labilithrix sp.]|nr:Iron-regulated protein precursor [Labilithrix sp.]
MSSKIRRRDVLLFGSSLGLVVLGAGAVAACRRDGADPPDRGKILADLSANVIVPVYTDAATQAKALEDALAPLRDAPTAEALTAARTAWKKARATWKVTDAFLFGPADDLALTGGIIDTPADVTKVEALVTATTPLDAGSIAALGANQRGFGALEALLFDLSRDDATMLAAFQAEGHRRGTFAALVASDLRTKIDTVRAAWSQAPTDYGVQLATAGRGSTVYSSERQGVDAVVNALIAASEVLIAVRLAKPLGLDKTPAVAAPELIESPRSDASIDDILAVLDGIEMVYLGRHGDASGLPLADAVAERSPDTDTRLRSDLQKAREAVRAVPGPLRTAVVERRDPVIAAHAAVREVKRCLLTQVAGALGTSVGFNVTDGD